MSERVEKAMAFAAERHGSQMYGRDPYTRHLSDVAHVLRRFGHGDDENLVASAWLHDVVEDTATTVEEVAAEFGREVADMVFAVTNEPGKNRAERHAKTYPKIAGLNRVTTLKLADRIANTEESIRSNSSLFGMYQKEWAGFREYLIRAGDRRMWAHLDFLMGGGWNGKPV
jgi:guanosine-3',5'-bis(diphosphate) 3'-pyrophosphohydrolase